MRRADRNDPLVVALVGSTGSGKSSVALQVAADVGAEIVAVDAFTVYRRMDIGTAKPTPADRAAVPHHVVDLLEPTEVCTVEWFQTQARGAIDDVLQRGGLPLLVGGSGLYFRSVVDALEFPPTDATVRHQIEARYATDPEAAHRALAAVDPEAAARMEPSNVRRAVRALEVIELTGRPFSDWRRAWDEYRSVYRGLRAVGLDIPRAELRAAVEDRVDAMIAAGWLEECRGLRDLDLSATARQAIGYAELFDVLDGTLDLEEATERIKVRTRQYAARQLRWFKADPRIQWVAARDAPEVLRSLSS